MSKKNKFYVKKFKEDKITVAEEKAYRWPLILFLIRNGRLIFAICLLLSLTSFVIAISLTISNMKKSTIVSYEKEGVVVTFDGIDESILDNATPITNEYANKIFDKGKDAINNNAGVVIKIKELALNDRTIIYYSDKTALVKYKDGSYLRIFPVNNNYGINDEGMIDANATTKKVTGKIQKNEKLGIELLYLSDGTVEVTRDNTTFFVRNSDITSLDEKFYTNLSIVSLPIKKEQNKIYYSNGTIKENDYIIVDNKKYNKKEEKQIHDNIKIIYYENGFAEIIKDDLSIIVEKSDHIVYDDNILEIVDNSKKEETDLSNFMDIKNITLKNKNDNDCNYMIVLEETSNYEKHNISKRLSNEYINYKVSLNGNKLDNKILNDNIKDTSKAKGINFKNNAYLISEGKLEKQSELSVKMGMWVSYETITNEYMNSAFIGTIKVYVESLD